MPDYGRDLRFGSFITPVNHPPHKAADLAVRSEEAGLDLVTFQDHPYQASFHDTWTLLTWVASRTERVTVAGNVLNMPLRRPAVLARAAASLDLLSGGRLAMGLGAGGFWDAIEGMGGGRLSAGESVEALEEAMAVLRGIWDDGEPGPFRSTGRFHPVPQAQRGPAPAHRIPLWVGAYKPRMLRLVGRTADGWLPSLSYLKPGDLRRGNAIIDEAATKAGRAPGDVQRVLNVGPDLGVDDLVDLATTEGIDTFVFMGDEGHVLDHVAKVLAPAVRERVAEARERAGTSARPARRRPALAPDLPDHLAERALEKGDPGWSRYTAGYLRGGAPALVLRPRDVAEVSDAVRVAAEVAPAGGDVPLGVLSAGHGLSGRSLNRGGLVLDVSALDEVTPLGDDLVRVGPGATWVQVSQVLSPLGLAISSGDYGGVGVGGLATAGGVGWFARSHGLTIDHLVEATVVLADGRVVTCSEEVEPDLFWAVRGAGANMGVAVSFTFRAARVGRVGFAQLMFAHDSLADLLTAWGTTMEAADRRITGELVLGPRQGPAWTASAMLVVDAEDPEEIVDLLQPFAGVGRLTDQNIALATYDQVMGLFSSDAKQAGRGEPVSHSGLATHLSPDLTARIESLLAAGVSHWFQIRAVGGAVADVAPDATAWAHRDAAFQLNAFGSGDGFEQHWDALRPHLAGLYLSFETDTDARALQAAFPPAHLARLRDLKRRYDPSGLFRDNFAISPA